MIHKIELGTSNYARFSRFREKKILLPEEKIEIAFISHVYELGMLAVTVKSGNQKKTFKTRGEAIDVTELCQNAGPLDGRFTCHDRNI